MSYHILSDDIISHDLQSYNVTGLKKRCVREE